MNTVSYIPRFYDRFGKPVFDWFAGLILLLIAAPVLLLVGVVVWATLGSPVLLRQERVGRGGQVFRMCKFRTMLPDRRVRRGAASSPQPDRRQLHKSAADPRHTPIGRFLRRTSLDELPQLLNVLAGQMSLVGPRPELADVVERVYEPWQHQRHLVKPGITGLWQVTERAEGDGTMHLHVDVDLEYIQQRRFSRDLRILLATPGVLVGNRRNGHTAPEPGEAQT